MQATSHTNALNVVVTGHQVGLLGGNLFTLYKLIGARKKADELKGKAIYWIEGNDADFKEISTLHYLDKDHQLKTLTWHHATGGQPIGHVKVDKALLSLHDAFFKDVVQTQDTAGLQKLCEDIYHEGRTLMACHMDMCSALYEPYHVEFFDSTSEEFLAYAHPFLKREVERTSEGSQAHAFALVEGKREAIFKREGAFYTRKGLRLSLDTLTLLPHVKMRNVLQDAYFNAHTFIAGPGEMGYIGMLKESYAFHEVRQAALQRRMSLTVLSPQVRQYLKQLRISWQEALTQSESELSKAYMRKEMNVDIHFLKKETKRLTHEYVRSLRGLGMGVKTVEKWLYNHFKNELGHARKAFKDTHQEDLAAISRISRELLPYGSPQERMFNVIFMLNMYGKAFLEKVDAVHRFDQVALSM